jgi:hypothetical protein
MKKIYIALIIILIIFWSIAVNAQSIVDVTEKQKTESVIQYKDTTPILIPAYVAKQIMIDLVSGDSAKEELKLAHTLLSIVEKKVTLKDSLINSMNTKNQVYANQILLYKEKEKQYIAYTKTLKSDVKKAKFKNHLFTTVGFVAILAGALFLFTNS